MTESNRRHSACKADALPTELSALSEDKQSEALSERKRKIHDFSKSILYQRGKYLHTLYKMAQRTGLEPATPGVTGRYSNQLNYRCTEVLT